MTLTAKLGLALVVLVAVALLVGVIVMYLELSSAFDAIGCFDGNERGCD